MLVIHPIDTNETNKGIKQELQNQGYEVQRVQRFRSQGAPLRTVLLWMQTKEDATKLLYSTGTSIGFSIITINEFNPNQNTKRIVRCSTCGRIGHPAYWCRDSRRCSHCMGPHYTQKCPHVYNNRRHRCINCRGKHRQHYHSALWDQCPTFRERYPWYTPPSEQQPSTSTTPKNQITLLNTSTNTSRNVWQPRQPNQHNKSFQHPRPTRQSNTPLAPAQIPTTTTQIQNAPSATSPTHPHHIQSASAFTSAPNIAPQRQHLVDLSSVDTNTKIDQIYKQLQLATKTNKILLTELKEANTKLETLSTQQLQLQHQIQQLRLQQTNSTTSLLQLANVMIQAIDNPTDQQLKQQIKQVVKSIQTSITPPTPTLAPVIQSTFPTPQILPTNLPIQLIPQSSPFFQPTTVYPPFISAGQLYNQQQFPQLRSAMPIINQNVGNNISNRMTNLIPTQILQNPNNIDIQQPEATSTQQNPNTGHK